jgi:hypothetical protein
VYQEISFPPNPDLPSVTEGLFGSPLIFCRLKDLNLAILCPGIIFNAGGRVNKIMAKRNQLNNIGIYAYLTPGSNIPSVSGIDSYLKPGGLSVTDLLKGYDLMGTLRKYVFGR